MAAKGFPTAPSTSRSTARRATASARSCRRASRCGCTATPTTMSARACPAAALVVRPSDNAPADFVAEENIIAGNVILFGATSGQAFLRGHGRRAVRGPQLRRARGGRGRRRPRLRVHDRRQGRRSSDPTGRNFAAGMSGGVAYVYDPDGTSAGQPQRRDGRSRATSTTTTSSGCTDMITAHVDATDSAVGQRILAIGRTS